MALIVTSDGAIDGDNNGESESGHGGHKLLSPSENDVGHVVSGPSDQGVEMGVECNSLRCG